MDCSSTRASRILFAGVGHTSMFASTGPGARGCVNQFVTHGTMARVICSVSTARSLLALRPRAGPAQKQSITNAAKRCRYSSQPRFRRVISGCAPRRTRPTARVVDKIRRAPKCGSRGLRSSSVEIARLYMSGFITAGSLTSIADVWSVVVRSPPLALRAQTEAT